jgi:alanyl-tRNA synthetase
MTHPTQRLYFDDAYLRAFEARVVALTEWHGQPAAVLDATALYPEGGGQPADQGTLAGVAVRDVQEADDVIYHVLAEPLPASVGDTVAGEIAWARRFDHMQQHTGQHTISGAFYRLLGADTTSWHLTGDTLSIDINQTNLSDAALAEAEHLANTILWDDVPVTAQIMTRAEMEALQLRKGTDREGGIRVVSIGDFDRIGCGGTHVRTTGRVGAIGLRRTETRGTQTRVEFVCGARALADFHGKTNLINAAIAALKTRQDDVLSHLDRLLAQSDEQRREITDLRRTLLGYEARDLLAAPTGSVADRPVVVRRLDGRTMETLRALAGQIAEAGGVALLGGVEAGKAQLAFACPKEAPLDLNAVLRAVLPLIGGKGGGQKFQAQGAGATLGALDAALTQATQQILG